MELAGQPMHPPHHIYGIDFSGAQDAGKKIWTSKGIVKGEILCENSSKAERHPLQSRTSSPTGCVGNLCVFTSIIKEYLSVSSNNVIVILIGYHKVVFDWHQTSLFRVLLS